MAAPMTDLQRLVLDAFPQAMGARNQGEQNATLARLVGVSVESASEAVRRLVVLGELLPNRRPEFSGAILSTAGASGFKGRRIL